MANILETDAEGKKKRIRPEDRITDFYIPDDDPIKGVFFPGRGLIADHNQLYRIATNLRDKARELTKSGYDEFKVTDGPKSFRGHVIEGIKGKVYAIRRMPDVVPKIDTLGLPPYIVDMLLHDKLAPRGGLVIICGETGQGKSTTIASTIMQRVTEKAAFCLTIEDPPEMPLHGIHGKGICYQTAAKIGGFSDALRGAMRSYPAQGGSMLYVGETRDGETAAQVVRAAINGHLVLTTLHANSVSSCAKRFITLATSESGSDEEARQITAASLKLILHQELKAADASSGLSGQRKLKTQFAFSHGESSPMAQAIRTPNAGSLDDVVEQQETRVKTMGLKTLFKER